eukprot:3994610-Amphidinium_carterae.2
MGLEASDGDAHRMLLVKIDNNFYTWHDKARNFMRKFGTCPTNLQVNPEVSRGKGTEKGWSRTMEPWTQNVAANYELELVLPNEEWPVYWAPLDFTRHMIDDRQRRHEEGWTC